MNFERKTEAEARKEILELVAEYCDTYTTRRKDSGKGTGFPTPPGSMTMRKW